MSIAFTPREAELLKRSLAAVSADPRRAADLFYANLFARLPDVRDLFVADMTRQGDKLLATLNAVILQIEDWQGIEAQIGELGLRHVAYGVQPGHYAPTGLALRAMLAEILGPDFSAEHDAAWARAYDAIAGAMITAIERRKSVQPDEDGGGGVESRNPA